MRDLQDKCHVYAWFVNPTARIIPRIPEKNSDFFQIFHFPLDSSGGSDRKPAWGQTPSLLSPHVKAAVGRVFVEQFSREPDVHGVLIWDRPRYHCAKGRHVPDNVAIVPLTTYSPDPQPVEKLRHYLAARHRSDRRLIAGATW